MDAWVGPVARYVAQGFIVTLGLSLVAVVGSLLLGGLVGCLLTLPDRRLRLLLRLYVDLWRGLPILVTLFFIFFALPAIGVAVSTFVAACVGLILWGSANVSEIVRGAVQSIPGTQLQAGRALGLPWVHTMGYVIIPQAGRRALPPLASLLTNLIQSTTLAAIIGVSEVLQTSRQSIERLTLSVGDSHSTAILAAVLVAFFVICFPLTLVSRRLERKFG